MDAARAATSQLPMWALATMSPWPGVRSEASTSAGACSSTYSVQFSRVIRRRTIAVSTTISASVRKAAQRHGTRARGGGTHAGAENVLHRDLPAGPPQQEGEPGRRIRQAEKHRERRRW